MKYFIGTLSTRVANHAGTERVCVAAENSKQAQKVLGQYAQDYSSQLLKNVQGDIAKYSGSSLLATVERVIEVSVVTFQEMRAILPSLGDAVVGELTSETEVPERAVTLARRLGQELNRRGSRVAHGRLLHAVAASIGEHDWFVLNAKPRSRFSQAKSKAAMRHAALLPFSARAEAVWLTEGDAGLAAALLHTTEASLLESFQAGEADFAFCGRPADWLPEDSLAKDYGDSVQLRSRYEVKVVEGNCHACRVVGYVDGKDVFHIHNHIYGGWHVGGSTCFPSDLETSRVMLACYREVMRVALDERAKRAVSEKIAA